MYALFNNTQFLQIDLDLCVEFCTLRLKLLNLCHYSLDIDLLLFLESIDITRDIEVVVILRNLFQGCAVAILLSLGAVAIGVDNLLDMLWAELVLCLDLLELLASIDKENIVVFLAAPQKERLTPLFFVFIL